MKLAVLVLFVRRLLLSVASDCTVHPIINTRAREFCAVLFRSKA
jgi:hypothetical protein